jgi:glucose-6-phosphate-specific signal transduction histidine kinase
VPRELWDHVIAVERELLANITKHAGATAVDIDVHVTDKLLLHPSWRSDRDGRRVGSSVGARSDAGVTGPMALRQVNAQA